jgi:hypothetical protein
MVQQEDGEESGVEENRTETVSLGWLLFFRKNRMLVKFKDSMIN